MSVIAPMSDLEAVNKMLASIGQAPVNTLQTSGIGDVARASGHLRETTRDVLTVGWAFNTDENFELTPDANGDILVPQGYLDLDATAATQNVTVRRHPERDALALYDLDSQTFKFTEPVSVTMVWGFEFNDLPQAARTYIATAAARRFQAQTVSSNILDRFNAEDEERAFLLLQRVERRSRDTNVFRRSPQLQRWTGRRAF